MLRLTADNERTNPETGDNETGSYRFPADALRQMRCSRLTAGRAAPDAVRLAEWALGNAQLRIDELREMFGPEDDHPPRAA